MTASTRARTVRILGIGFPPSVPVPTQVTACGDGIHTVIAPSGSVTDCACDRMTFDLTDYPWLPGPVHVVLADAAMDNTVVGVTRRLNGRMVRP